MASTSRGTLRSRGASRIRQEGDDGWMLGERLLAAFTVVLVAARISIGSNLVVSDLIALVLLPVWLPVLRRYKGARTLVAVGLLAMAASFVLTRQADVDHRVSMQRNLAIMKLLASCLGSIGLVLWARERLHMWHLYALFGLGLLWQGPSNMKLYAENPWKFGFSVPLTVGLIGYAAARGHKQLTMWLLAIFAVICTFTDARSNLGVLVLTMALVVWRAAPRKRRRRSTAGTLAVLAGVAILAYYAIQALILDGALGEETRRRSLEQLRISGSLLLGGRPELGASLALILHRPLGFGGGTFLNRQDLLVAKGGMTKLGYDPNNGYVHKFMFGRGTELHSMLFDLWAWCGVVGLLFAFLIALQVLVALGRQLNAAPIEGSVLVFCCLLTLWNLFFSPWLASMPLLVLVLGLGLVRRQDGHVLRRGAVEEF